MHSSISSGRTSDRLARVAGMGVLAGSIVFAASSWMSCAPGALDCESVSSQTYCGNGTGMGGATPPGTGGSGGGGGTITLASPIMGCALPGIATIGDFETKFIAKRCGKGGCHTTPMPIFAPDMAAPEIFKRLVNKTTMGNPLSPCKDGPKYIDTNGDPANSYLVAKVRDDMPKCPSGSAGGLRMPFNEMPGVDSGPLNAMEVECFRGYAKAAAGK